MYGAGTMRQRAFHRNLPAMIFNNAVHQRQTQTGTLTRRFGGEKRFKHAIQILRGYAVAIITDA